MRYATAHNTGNSCGYSNLLADCQHSRLKAALSGYSNQSPNARRPGMAPAHAPQVVSEATKAYLWVVAMSVTSLLGVIVTGTINA